MVRQSPVSRGKARNTGHGDTRLADAAMPCRARRGETSPAPSVVFCSSGARVLQRVTERPITIVGNLHMRGFM